MRAAFFLLLALITAAGPRAQADLSGDWSGSISGLLPLVLHIEAAADGYTATLDSPTQGAFGIPVAEVLLEGSTVTLTLPMLPASFTGELDADTLAGYWSQSGTEQPLTLVRGGEVMEMNRPQEPQPPFPYTVESVRFEGGESEVILSGTTTIPEGEGPFPAVVLVSGSGPQDRNEELLGHKPFLVLADALTRRGILVLRYDDRGVGQSTGDFEAGTTSDFADDAQAAVEELAGRYDVTSIGIIGHSEGGLIAPIVADASDDVDFVVLLAGPSVSGADVLAHQNGLIVAVSGADEAAATAYADSMRAVLADIVAIPLDRAISDAERASVVAHMRAVVDALPEEGQLQFGADTEAREHTTETLIDTVTSPWMRYFLAYDPGPALRALDVPALGLFGSKDLQVYPAQNAEPMREALSESASREWDVRVFDGLNHLFQTAETGSPTEYAEIEETMSPVVLEAVADWILGLE